VRMPIALPPRSPLFPYTTLFRSRMDGRPAAERELVPLRRNRDFVLLQIGQALSTVGSEASGIAYTLLVLALTGSPAKAGLAAFRSEEHTSELQSRVDLVCRLLLE